MKAVNQKKQNGFFELVVVLVITTLVVGVLAYGKLVKFSRVGGGYVLSQGSGSDGDSSGSSGSGSSGSSGGSDSSGSGSSGSSSSGSGSDEDRFTTESGVEVKFDDDENEERTEIRFSETERVKIRTRDGEERIDVYQGEIKVRYEFKDGRLVIKAEIEGEEGEVEDDEIFKIDDRLEEEGIRVSTTSGERFILQRGNAGAVTDFPLSIDLATNELVVTTPAGEKRVAVLPDQAIANLVAVNTISRLGANVLVGNVEGLEGIEGIVSLGEREGVPIYEILGVLDQRLLGFIPVSIEREVIVSAETGETLEVSQSFLSKVIDFLAF